MNGGQQIRKNDSFFFSIIYKEIGLGMRKRSRKTTEKISGKRREDGKMIHVNRISRGKAVKNRILTVASLILVVLCCDKSPQNPSLNGDDRKQVRIQQLETEYVPATPPTDGILADKVNVLRFEFEALNFSADRLEFFGRAEFEGPPDDREHAVHFRTDSVDPLCGEDIEFNILEQVRCSSRYILSRPKFPTNEYAPFEGEQGKIKQWVIYEAWGYDENQNRFSIQLAE
jgi:hypothetical protein